MRFSVFTVMMPEYEPRQAARILGEMGYDGVEWRVTRPNYVEDQPPAYWSNNRCTVDIARVDELASELSGICREAALDMPALGTYMGCHDLEDIDRAMGAAAAMGCSMIRVSPPIYDRAIGYRKQFAEAAAAYIDVEALARKHGVKACMEIHMGNICSSPSLAHRLLSLFDPLYVGAILDPGNMVYEGYEDWRLGMELLGPYLAHVHLKSASWAVVGERPTGEKEWRAQAAPLTEGVIDFHRLFEDLRAVGYDGFCSFEDFSESGTTLEKLERNLAYVRSL